MSKIEHTDQIPFLDLVTPHKELEVELLSTLQDTLRTAGFVGGPKVEEFEREFARFCDASHCVGVASGTDAVRFALTATGVKPGDVVVTVPHTFIATTEAISQAGARPDFVDIDQRTYCMDPRKLEQYLEHQCSRDEKTGRLIHRKLQAPVTAVVPVHIYGQMADMDPILDLARKYNLIVVEDACQAHGAEYFSKKSNSWKKAGSMGQAAAFSFYPGKNLGACGEAGAVTTNNEATARTMRMLRDHGQARKYYHEVEGYNGRLDALQAGFLTVKLRHLARWNRQRQEAAKRYDSAFAALEGVDAPISPDSVRAVYHLYVIRVRGRDALQKHLADSGIGTGIHYPVPLHLQEAYRHLQYPKGSFPVSERVASEILSLPMYPQLRADQSERVVRAVASFLSARRRPASVEQSQPVAL
jgi:dTDP-4-amino-4,6-dideoxygalactose transaminase